MPPRVNQEIVLHLHTLLSHPATHSRSLALPKELRARKPELHVRQMYPETDARSGSEWMESFLRFGSDFVV